MRRFIGGFFFIIAVSAGIAMLLTLLKMFFGLFPIDWGGPSRGTQIPGSWAAVAAYSIVLAASLSLGAIAWSENIAGYYRRNRAVRYGSALLFALFVHRSCVSIRYANAGGKLTWAVANGKKKMVSQLLRDGEYTPKYLYRAWRQAVAEDQREAGALLAPYILFDGEPCLAFYWSSAHGNSEDPVAFVRILVAAGGDPRDCPDSNLHYNVVNYGHPNPAPVLRYLLELGVEPDDQVLAELDKPDPYGRLNAVRAVYGRPLKAEAE